MEIYVTEDELDLIFMENCSDLYDRLKEGDTGVFYRDFYCATEKKLKQTFSKEQKEIFFALKEHSEIIAGALTDEVFRFAYKLCLNKMMEEINRK